MSSQLAFQKKISHKPLLICFSHLRWHFVYQRPQHLLTRATRDYDVAYFEEPVREAIRAPNLRREFSPGGVVILTPVIPDFYSEAQTSTAQRLLLDSFLSAEQAATVVFWYYTPAALSFSANTRRDVTIYDCMDELSAFKMAHPSLAVFERNLLNEADVVFTGGRSLYEAKKRLHSNIHPFPSSIDADHFGKARGLKECPADVAHIRGPRLGFFGVIDERMDLDLVDTMARAKPDWNFVMIGPVVKIDPDTLPRHNNIHWIGGRDYRVLPHYIASWDIGFMPFALNEATQFISPTKTPEYLAAGCPVVCTPIADVVNPYGTLGLVEIASTADEAIASVERLLTADKTFWIKAVDAHLNGNSWDRTWERMQNHIAACLDQREISNSSHIEIGASRV